MPRSDLPTNRTSIVRSLLAAFQFEGSFMSQDIQAKVFPVVVFGWVA